MHRQNHLSLAYPPAYRVHPLLDCFLPIWEFCTSLLVVRADNLFLTVLTAVILISAATSLVIASIVSMVRESRRGARLEVGVDIVSSDEVER